MEITLFNTRNRYYGGAFWVFKRIYTLDKIPSLSAQRHASYSNTIFIQWK